MLEKLEENVTCLISKIRIKNPLCGPDLYAYEKQSITKWLLKNQSSPITRLPMTVQNMIGNNTIEDIITAMNDYKIEGSVMKRVHQVLESNDNKAIIERLNKAEKKKKKKLKQKANNQLKKGAIDALKEYNQFMESLGWYNSINWKLCMPTKPSYSIMHSLKEGFSIVMYSGTHRVNLDDNSLHMHKGNGVRLHIPPWMCLVWHESIYHSGAKSRNTPRYQ